MKIKTNVMLIIVAIFATGIVWANPDLPQRTQPSVKAAPAKAQPATPTHAQSAHKSYDSDYSNPRRGINKFFSDYEQLVDRARNANRRLDRDEIQQCSREKNYFEDQYNQLKDHDEWANKDRKRYFHLRSELEDYLRLPAPKKALPKRAAPTTR